MTLPLTFSPSATVVACPKLGVFFILDPGMKRMCWTINLCSLSHWVPWSFFTVSDPRANRVIFSASLFFLYLIYFF